MLVMFAVLAVLAVPFECTVLFAAVCYCLLLLADAGCRLLLLLAAT